MRRFRALRPVQRIYYQTICTICVVVLIICISDVTFAKKICQKAPMHTIVEIKPNGETRKGSGIILTTDGYIITARHVVDGFLDVFIEMYEQYDKLQASLIGADDFLDVALLKIRLPIGLKLIPAFTLPPQKIEQFTNSTLCIGGYGFNEEFDPNINAMKIDLEPLQFNKLEIRNKMYGYTYVEGQLKSGFSGGGAFIEDKLYGITLKRGKFGSQILPFNRIQHFLSRNGLALSPRGEIVVKGDLQGVAQTAKNNRSNLDRIMTDVTWKCNFPFFEGNTKANYLEIYYKRYFPMQEVTGFFDGKVTPAFEDKRFGQWLKEHKKGLSFRISDDLIEGKIVFQHAVASIKALLKDYKRNHNLDININNLSELRIRGIVIRETGNDIGPIEISLKPKK